MQHAQQQYIKKIDGELGDFGIKAGGWDRAYNTNGLKKYLRVGHTDPNIKASRVTKWEAEILPPIRKDLLANAMTSEARTSGQNICALVPLWTCPQSTISRTQAPDSVLCQRIAGSDASALGLGC